MIDATSWIERRYRADLAADATLPQKIDAALAAHSAAHGGAAAAPTYTTEVDRLAYCIGHFPIGVVTVSTVLHSLASRRPFPIGYTFFRDSLNIVSLGGGPGADLVGCLCALEAVPRTVTPYLADAEAGWEQWATAAINAVVQQDPFLKLGVRPLKFQQLDLNDTEKTTAYFKGFKDAGPTIFVAHRVVDRLTSPTDFMTLLASEFLPDEALVLVVSQPRHVAQLDDLATKLDASRQGWIRRHDTGYLCHHGWTVPTDLWDALTHKPEVRADYDALLAMRDLKATLRWP